MHYFHTSVRSKMFTAASVSALAFTVSVWPADMAMAADSGSQAQQGPASANSSDNSNAQISALAAQVALLQQQIDSLIAAKHQPSVSPLNLAPQAVTAGCVNGSGGTTTLECGNGSTTGSAIDATAVGANSEAVAVKASAFGNNASATESDSTALGSSTSASGTNSTAVGGEATASGSSTAIGHDSSSFAPNATSLGASASAAGANAIAIGVETVADKSGAIAIGGDDEDIGTTGAVATGTRAIAIGSDALANERNALALGGDSAATSDSATAVGYSASAGGGAASAFGNNASANGSLSTASGSNSVANGFSGTATGFFSEANDYARTPTRRTEQSLRERSYSYRKSERQQLLIRPPAESHCHWYAHQASLEMETSEALRLFQMAATASRLVRRRRLQVPKHWRWERIPCPKACLR